MLRQPPRSAEHRRSAATEIFNRTPIRPLLRELAKARKLKLAAMLHPLRPGRPRSGSYAPEGARASRPQQATSSMRVL